MIRRFAVAAAIIGLLSPLTADTASAGSTYEWFYFGVGSPLSACQVDDPGLGSNFLSVGGAACIAAGPGNVVNVAVGDEIHKQNIGFTIYADRPVRDATTDPNGAAADAQDPNCDTLHCDLKVERSCGGLNNFVMPGGATRVVVSVDTPRGTVSTANPGLGHNPCPTATRNFGTFGTILININ